MVAEPILGFGARTPNLLLGGYPGRASSGWFCPRASYSAPCLEQGNVWEDGAELSPTATPQALRTLGLVAGQKGTAWSTPQSPSSTPAPPRCSLRTPRSTLLLSDSLPESTATSSQGLTQASGRMLLPQRTECFSWNSANFLLRRVREQVWRQTRGAHLLTFRHPEASSTPEQQRPSPLRALTLYFLLKCEERQGLSV